MEINDYLDKILDEMENISAKHIKTYQNKRVKEQDQLMALGAANALYEAKSFIIKLKGEVNGADKV